MSGQIEAMISENMSRERDLVGGEAGNSLEQIYLIIVVISMCQIVVSVYKGDGTGNALHL